MSSRRANGSGSVYQRKDGRWVAVVTVGGKRVSRYTQSQKEAEDLLVDLQLENRRGRLTAPTETTLDEWVAQWLELKTPDIRPSTVKTYQSTLAKVTDEIGSERVDRLTPLLLTHTFARLQRLGHGRRRLQLAHTYLKSCLDQAVDFGLIGTNPMERVPKPRWEPNEREYWSIEQAGRFVDTCLSTQSRWGPLFALLATTGLRISEALGLEWSDVDWSGASIRVRRAIVWRGNHYDVLPPKTKAGGRVVSLPSSAITALCRVRETAEETSPDQGVFRTSTGQPPRHEHTRNALIALCREADVPRINVHGLRHVGAMLALEASGDIYLVQRRLGHSHVGVTLAVYGYPARNESIVAPEIDRLLSLEDSG